MDKKIDQLNKEVRKLKEELAKRKNIEEELTSSEERLKILFNQAPDAYFLSDLRGNFLDGNKAAEKLIGYKKEELIGKNMLKLKLLPLDQLPKATKRLAEHALGKATKPGEFTLFRKDGNRVPVEISGSIVRIKGKILVLGIVRDISERKKAEEELKKKNKELERFNTMAVKRELRMVELKKKIKETEKQLDKTK